MDCWLPRLATALVVLLLVYTRLGACWGMRLVRRRIVLQPQVGGPRVLCSILQLVYSALVVLGGVRVGTVVVARDAISKVVT